MKKVLILGAGFVSRPGVNYLLESKNLNVTVADIMVKRAQKLVEGYKNGKAVKLDINDTGKLDEVIRQNDIIVSLLPFTLHLKVAELCVKNNKDMATTSYVSEGMKKLDPVVKAKGLLFMNELGVDPGIDHMSAKKIIDEIRDEGGKIVEFYSYTGGLPAPEDNDNPFGYKFSWSPKGVVLASKNPARFLEKGNVVEIPGEELFLNYRTETVEGLGEFEVYPNRDSLMYRELYGLTDVKTLIRGTYRYPGWCDTFKKIVDLGLVSDIPVEDISGITYSEMTAKSAGLKSSDNLKSEIASICNLSQDSEVMRRLEWLGLFGNDAVPNYDNYLDILSDLLKKKLYYKEGEKDMILMRHKFVVENSDGSNELITSTLIDYGIPGGDSSMSRTVSFPLAISVKMMAEGKFDLTGVHIPVLKDIYMPVLKELESLKIKMTEKRTSL